MCLDLILIKREIGVLLNLSTSASRSKQLPWITGCNKDCFISYFIHHLLQVNGTYPPRLLLHLLHTLLGQVEVGLQMMSHHSEPEYTHQYDGPQPQRIKRLLGHPDINRKTGVSKRDNERDDSFFSGLKTQHVAYFAPSFGMEAETMRQKGKNSRSKKES